MAIGMSIFTSCGSDDDTIPVDPTLCDSLVVQINVMNDSLNNILTVETFGYTGALTYAWSTGETTESISVDWNDEGTYSVTVTADGVDDCEATGSVDLSNPVDCSNLSSSITMSSDSSNLTILYGNASGGTPPYSYLWSTGETEISIEISEEGTYAVSITDANGCVTGAIYTYEMTVVDCSTFGASFTQIDTAGTVLLLADVFGGTAPYTYEWSTGAVTTWGVLEANTSGTYSVIITDANGCFISGSYTVNINPCANYGVSIFFNPDSLQMGQDFLVSHASGGLAPNTYLWSNGETGGGIEVTGASGTFSVTATDTNGCTAEDSYEL